MLIECPTCKFHYEWYYEVYCPGCRTVIVGHVENYKLQNNNPIGLSNNQPIGYELKQKPKERFIIFRIPRPGYDWVEVKFLNYNSKTKEFTVIRNFVCQCGTSCFKGMDGSIYNLDFSLEFPDEKSLLYCCDFVNPFGEEKYPEQSQPV